MLNIQGPINNANKDIEELNKTNDNNDGSKRISDNNTSDNPLSIYHVQTLPLSTTLDGQLSKATEITTTDNENSSMKLSLENIDINETVSQFFIFFE